MWVRRLQRFLLSVPHETQVPREEPAPPTDAVASADAVASLDANGHVSHAHSDLDSSILSDLIRTVY